MAKSSPLERIFALKTLEDLRRHLTSSDGKRLRVSLLREFWKACWYSNAEQWNRAVRICEALAIVGWGDCEPVEAFATNDWTVFRNRYDETRFVCAEWSKRKGGITIRGEAFYHASPDRPESSGPFPIALCIQELKLSKQRNWIPKNPIRLYQWLDGSDANTRKLVDSIHNELYPALDRGMKPDTYGSAIDRIWIDFYFCTSGRGNKETFVVIDEDVRMLTVQLHKRLLTMYSGAEIKRENLFLRKRYDYRPFQHDKGEMKVTLHFPKEFNKLSHPAQKREFAQHLSTAVSGVVERLGDRGLDYDFGKMQRDFEAILRSWLKKR